MINKQLIDYIEQQSRQGLSRESITQNLLLQGGWQRQDMDEAFQVINQNGTTSENYNDGSKNKNGKATIGLVFGILSLFVWAIGIIGTLISITGLIFSINGRKFTEKTGVATIGIVLSSLGLLASLFSTLGLLFAISLPFFSSFNKIQPEENFTATTSQKQQNQIVSENTAPKIESPVVPEKQTQPTVESADPEKVPSSLEKQAYVNDKLKFSINYPKGWSMDNTSTAIVKFSHMDSSIESYISIKRESAGGKKLEDFVSDTINAAQKIAPETKISRNEKFTINTMPAEIIEFSIYMKGVTTIRGYQLFVIKDNIAYTSMGLTKIDFAWNKYKDAIKSSLLTFKFI